MTILVGDQASGMAAPEDRSAGGASPKASEPVWTPDREWSGVGEWRELPPDLIGTRFEDLPPDPLAGFEREMTDADAPVEGLPGGALAAELESKDLTELADVDLVDVIAAAGRLAAWVSALELTAAAELTARTANWRGVGPEAPAGVQSGQWIEPERMAAAEIAAAQNISEGFATFKVELADAMRRLPLTRIALAAGRIDLAKARAIVEAVEVLDDEAAARVEARVMDRAPEQTLSGVKRSLRRAVIAADPAAAEARRERRVRDREVIHYPGMDGVGHLQWTGPIEQVEAFWIWLTAAAMASRGPGDTRTLAQCRSDVLADIAANGLDSSLTHTGAALPTYQGRRPNISVVVAASTLLGLDDEPAELAGAGPITAELARRIAGDGTWRRLLTDPVSGRLIELSEDSYEPSQALRDHVIARDQHCRWPGCRFPANRCDLDHAIPHPEGPTSARNMHPQERGHHLVKTFTDTTVVIEDDGTTVWTLPSGRSYRVPPTQILEHPDMDPQALRDAVASMLDREPDPAPDREPDRSWNPEIVDCRDVIAQDDGPPDDPGPPGDDRGPPGDDHGPPGDGPTPDHPPGAARRPDSSDDIPPF